MTVVAIIAILMSLLIPAISMVRRTAKETQQKAQFATIEMAIMAFKGDYGDYPPSDCNINNNYCGAQKLAEALLGWDLLGFHPNSTWGALGSVYDATNNLNLEQRKGPYLETSRANAFRLGISAVGSKDGLFDSFAPLGGQTFVICDSFGVKPVQIVDTVSLKVVKTVKAGTPILYYKANAASKTIDMSVAIKDRIYNAYDNQPLVDLRKMMNTNVHHPIELNGSDYPVFYDYDYRGGIRDPKITTLARPYRPDSYILISAGLDGLYGTSDDITNFGQ